MLIRNNAAHVLLAAILALSLRPAFGFDPVVPTHEATVKKGDVIEGQAYPPGSQLIVFDATGKVSTVALSANYKMNGHTILRGTRLALSNGILSCYWSVPKQKINAITLPPQSQVCFNKNGRLTMIHLHGPVVIEGRSYPTHTWVGFGARGEVVPVGQADTEE